MISENVVQSTLHFQKRIEKELKLMQYPNFLAENSQYSVSSYFYRIEFQMRGAPHLHCLLWLEDDKGNSAPTFWNGEKDDSCDIQSKMKNIEDLASILISASEDDMLCDEHQKELQEKNDKALESNCLECYSAIHDFEKCDKHNFPIVYNCDNCEAQKKLITKFQTHNHTFTCKKKKKGITIKANEGHGRLDEKIEGQKISDYTDCRFKFPQFPMNTTKLILGIPKDIDNDELSKRKKDLKKIKKFLIRETYSENKDESEKFQIFKQTTFLQFLFNVGMFTENKMIKDYNEGEKQAAYQRYLNALSASVRGTGAIFLKRNPKDILTNNFNRRLMSVHQANHDIQVVIDQVFFFLFSPLL